MKTINGKPYRVLPNEFEFVLHERFNNLKIIPELGPIERTISLIREVSNVLSLKNIVCISPTHGGFIPIQLSSTIESVFINTMYTSQIENTLANIELNPHVFISTEIPKTPSFIFIQDETNPAEFFSQHVVLSLCPRGYHFTGTPYWLSVPDHFSEEFLKEFHYFIKENELQYDNLIDLCIMVKNAGDQFENMLRENIDFIDKWTILDTGSTDNTIEIINRVLVGKKRGHLYQEPFIDFPTSRNRCLDLAGQTCKFTLMLDDTYVVRGQLREFLNVVRGDQFANSYSSYISSDDVQYTSNRIVKTENKLRYIFKLHEVITPENNINVSIPHDVAYIFDYRFDYMENRTMERKEYDLRVLEEGLREDPNNSRNLYYMAQTYNLMKKYDLAFDYFMERVNHPNEGFIQEKYDSYFEAGRLANFQLNRPWAECKALYEKAYEIDTKRPESQYFIGIHYYLEGDYPQAWFYFKRAYEIGYPIHCEFSLKPTLSFFFLPKFMAELCYTYAKDYTLGRQVSELFLTKNGPVDKKGEPVLEYMTMSQWYSIFSLLEQTKPVPVPETQGDLPVLAFVADSAPAFGTWTGRDILTRGIGGSETYIIEMARWIQKSGQFRVLVFCRCEEMDIFENVMYLPITEYVKYISENRVYSCIISRFMEYVPCSLLGHVDNVYIVLHDVMPEGTIIPVYPKLKKIFCLSEWHVGHFLKMFPQFTDRTLPFYYGVNQSLDMTEFVKIPYKFIYSSYPNRGLLNLLTMWPSIVEREPRASLHLYCNIDGEWVNRAVPEEMKKIRELLRGPSLKNVYYHGWVSKQVLMESWATADVWFYPTQFIETFCLTALECAISKTLAITMDLGSLKNVVADRGILLQGNPTDPEWQKNTIDVLFDVLENQQKKEELIERNYQWARELSWENQAKKLLPMLFGANRIFMGKLNYTDMKEK